MTAELSIINARSLAHLCCTSWNILYSLRVCIILKLFVLLFYYRLKTLCKRFNTVNVLLKPWTNFEEMDFSDEQQQKVNCSHRPGNLQIQIESPCFAFTSSASIKRYMSFRWVSDFFFVSFACSIVVSTKCCFEFQCKRVKCWKCHSNPSRLCFSFHIYLIVFVFFSECKWQNFHCLNLYYGILKKKFIIL